MTTQTIPNYLRNSTYTTRTYLETPYGFLKKDGFTDNERDENILYFRKYSIKRDVLRDFVLRDLLKQTVLSDSVKNLLIENVQDCCLHCICCLKKMCSSYGKVQNSCLLCADVRKHEKFKDLPEGLEL